MSHVWELVAVPALLVAGLARGVRCLVVRLRSVASILGILGLFAVCATVGSGQTQDAFLAQTGLDEDLVALLPVEGRFGRVLFVFVYLSPRIFESRIRADLAESLRPYVGTNALFVWAYSMAPAVFEPQALTFVQGENVVSLSPERVVPIEGDFLRGRILPGRPLAAVVRLGEAFDPTKAIVIAYGEVASTTLAVNGDRNATKSAEP